MRLALEGEEGLEWGGRLSSARWDATRCLRAGRQDHQAVKSEANVGQDRPRQAVKHPVGARGVGPEEHRPTFGQMVAEAVG